MKYIVDTWSMIEYQTNKHLYCQYNRCRFWRWTNSRVKQWQTIYEITHRRNKDRSMDEIFSSLFFFEFVLCHSEKILSIIEISRPTTLFNRSTGNEVSNRTIMVRFTNNIQILVNIIHVQCLWNDLMIFSMIIKFIQKNAKKEKRRTNININWRNWRNRSICLEKDSIESTYSDFDWGSRIFTSKNRS